MKVYRRLLGTMRSEGAGPQRRGNVRLEILSLLAVLLVGALAIGATSASAEEDGTTGHQPTAAVMAASGGEGELLADGEQGVIIGEVDAGPVDAEFEACMREQGVELPGPMFNESFSAGEDDAPSFERAPVDESFREAAEQCGHHTMGVFTHELGADVPAVSAEEVAAFDECLRNAGVDLPGADVTPPSTEPETGGVSMHVFIGSSDPDQRAAFEQCAALLPEGVVTVGMAETD